MTSWLTGWAVAMALLQFGLISTAAAGQEVELRIGCVLANNSGKDFDQRLVALRPRFNRMFRYTSYSLVKEKHQRVAIGAKMGFHVPGGRYLLVVPTELRKDGRVAMKVMLLDGARPIVDTSVSLRNHSTFLVAGPQQNDGALILSIGAQVSE